jgi:hypothetical protein
MALSSGTTEYLRETEGLQVAGVVWSTESRWKRGHSRPRSPRPRILGIGLGDGRRLAVGAVRLLGSRLLRPRHERVDELEHVVGEFAGTVGGRQAFDQLQSALAVPEVEELLVVDSRTHVERA